MSLQRADFGTKTRITTATTTPLKAGPGFIKRIIFGVPVSTGTVAVYDDPTTTNNQFALITSTADLKPFFIDFDCQFTNGLTIVTGVAAQDITVVWG